MLASLVFVLLCALEIQCAPSVIVSASCEENACNATCRHQFQGSFGVKTVGKCENNECQCYRSAMCDPKACQRLCQERYGNGTDVRSECLSDVCNCAWKGTCVLSECKRQCADRFPGNPNVDVKCDNNLCTCEFTESNTQAGKGTKPPYVDIEKNKNAHRLRVEETLQQGTNYAL